MAGSQDYVPIPGSERNPLPGARIVGPSDPAERINVTLLVRRRPSSEGLTSTLAEMDARLPSERSYFSREELEAEHGADPDDMDKVKAFAYEHHLDVVEESSARRTIVLSGTVAALSAAFGVELANYEYPEGTYRGRTGPVHVPAELQDVVQDVLGLDNRPAARPHFRGRFANWSQGDQPVAQPHVGGGIPHFPNEMARLYNFPTEGDGTGQCIGIIELGGGFRPKDLKNYFAEIGIPQPTVTARSVPSVPPGHNQPTGDPNGADGEVMLDIEVAGAIAPGAKIVVYFAANTNQGFLDAVTTAIHDAANKPSVISISWGGRERGPISHMQEFEQALQDAAALGVTVCCASGDDGSSDIRPPFIPPFNVPDGLAHVDHPASCPHALGCGGTKLVSSGEEILSEVVWNDPGAGATGGGVSDVFDKPAYQDGVDIPSVNPGGRVGRIVPDVAGEAAPATGYKVLVDGQQTVIGGTSAVAPLWAGLIALINQSLGQPVGFINPLLYHIAAENDTFRDITQGNNEKNAPGYRASQGYDACTGWGSPNGNNLLKTLRGST